MRSMIVPLAHSACGDARYSTAAAISLARATRPKGLCARISSPAGPVRCRAAMAVSTKPGATVVDVGIHRVPDAAHPSGTRLTGDVHSASVKAVAGALTPVPGGVGPMTVTMLLENTIAAAERVGQVALHKSDVTS